MTISVVMSVYNERFEWVQKAVESILKQSFSDFEFIIIVDNPNIDEVVDNYLNDISNKDCRVKIIRNEENVGLALSLNRGIEEAQGEYIARMDADDISEINRFELELDFIRSTNSDIVSTNRIIIDEKDNVLSYPTDINEDPNIYLPYSSLIVHPTVLMKTKTVKELNGYRAFPRSQDYDLWLRMLSANRKISILEKRLLRYRVRTSSLTNKNRLQQFYIHQYQKKLFKERIKYGVDSFSVEGLEHYLSSKRITEERNRKCIKVMEILESAQLKMNNGDRVRGNLETVHAFFIFPEIVSLVIINKLQKLKIERSRQVN